MRGFRVACCDRGKLTLLQNPDYWLIKSWSFIYGLTEGYLVFGFADILEKVSVVEPILLHWKFTAKLIKGNNGLCQRERRGNRSREGTEGVIADFYQRRTQQEDRNSQPFGAVLNKDRSADQKLQG